MSWCEQRRPKSQIWCCSTFLPCLQQKLSRFPHPCLLTRAKACLPLSRSSRLFPLHSLCTESFQRRWQTGSGCWANGCRPWPWSHTGSCGGWGCRKTCCRTSRKCQLWQQWHALKWFSFCWNGPELPNVEFQFLDILLAPAWSDTVGPEKACCLSFLNIIFLLKSQPTQARQWEGCPSSGFCFLKLDFL